MGKALKEASKLWSQSQHEYVIQLGVKEITYSIDQAIDICESDFVAGAKYVQNIVNQFNITDIDVPVFTHTKEFRDHFEYIKKELIKELI